MAGPARGSRAWQAAARRGQRAAEPPDYCLVMVPLGAQGTAGPPVLLPLRLVPSEAITPPAQTNPFRLPYTSLLLIRTVAAPCPAPPLPAWTATPSLTSRLLSALMVP